VAVDLLGESSRGSTAAAIIANERLIVPAHFDAEVYAAFRGLFRRRLVDGSRFDIITLRLIALAAERVALPPLLFEVHRLAERLSAADAFYVALARARGVELLTADAALARAAAGLARVRLIA
jgi:predicted nucleic acid-binding protein